MNIMRGREDPGQRQVWPHVKLHGSAAQQSMGKAVLCREADEVARGEAAAQLSSILRIKPEQRR